MTQELLPTIDRFSWLMDRELVPVKNSGQAVYSEDHKGRRWVRKRARHSIPGMVLAEALSWLLCRKLDIRTPDGAVLMSEEQGEVSWLSRLQTPVRHWVPGRLFDLRNLEDIGAMLCIDAIVYNYDRHSDNVLMQPVKDGEFIAWIIDFGNATIGRPKEFASLGEETPDPGPLLDLMDLPFDVLEPSAMELALRVESLDSGLVEYFVSEACSASMAEPSQSLSVALDHRLKNARALVSRYFSDLGGRR